jgi:hypothetical protein
VDFALYRTIALQGGVFTTAQARERYSEWEIRQLVSTGRWRRSSWRGVLVDAELPESPSLELRAASLAAGPDLVACHSTAARLWGFDVLGESTLHVVGPAGLVNRRLPGIQVHPSSLGSASAQLAHGPAVEASALHRWRRLPTAGGDDRNDGDGARAGGPPVPAIMKSWWGQTDARRRVIPPTS